MSDPAECHRTTYPNFEMDTLNRRRNTFVAGAALVLIALVYYRLIFRYGLNLADEGNVGLISQRLMHGERPFLDVLPGYNVLWFYPISTLFKLFGTNLLLMRAYFYSISTASGLIAFVLLRRLDAPLWLAFAQGLAVFSVTGQYFKAYIPFLVLSNLFAITLFLTSQRKALLSVGAGLLLGTTYLIRVDIGIFLTAVWVGVILLQAVLLDRRLRLNLLVAGNLLLGVAVMHLPFIYDAYHRHFLQPFADQYPNVAALILNRLLPQPTQIVANNQDRTGVASAPTPAGTVVENANNQDQTGVAHGPTPAGTVVENHRVTVDKPATFLRRRAFQQIFQKSPRIEYRLLALLTYIPPLLICALLLAGLYLGLSKRMAVDRWLLFSALLTGCLAAFPQFFFFRLDLPMEPGCRIQPELRACLKSRMRGHVIVGVMTISTDVDKLYDTDLTDAAWTLIAPMLPAARPGGRPRKINIRAVLNAIFYLLRTGCQWRLLPREFPGWSTVYHYFQAWKNAGVWTCIQRSMYQQARRQAGRAACPSVVIMDGQSVKTTERGGIRGFDAHKRVKGRKRHILVDTFGLLIAVEPPTSLTERRLRGCSVA